jgi:hypothetical protein
MRRPPERKPVEWRQLCAIAREILTTSPTIDDFEWKERIKDRLFALELTYPAPIDRINRAMDAVERALANQGWRRPAPAPPASPPTQPSTQRDPPWRRHSRQPTSGFTSLADLMTALRMTNQRDSAD